MNFTTKDSGDRQQFDTGMQRDLQVGKSRPDLISPFMTERVGHLLARGAEKYDENNWMKGQPFSRALASLERHLMQFKQSDIAEDHLAAIVFNTMCIIHYQEMIRLGRLDPALNDLMDYTSPVDTKGWKAQQIDECTAKANTAKPVAGEPF